jgi:coproporphyrinogen III oxidase
VFTKNCWDAFVSLEDQLLKQMCTRKYGLNKKKDQLLSRSIYFFTCFNLGVNRTLAYVLQLVMRPESCNEKHFDQRSLYTRCMKIVSYFVKLLVHV